MKVTHGFAPVAGGRLYYECSGEGPPLLLLHGFALDQRIWDAQFHYFSDRFRVIRCDLRGFGRSSIPEGAYAHADDLADLFAFLGVTQSSIAGLSLGGRVAIDFALLYPEMVSRLVLADAALGGHQWSEGWRKRFAEPWRLGQMNQLPQAKTNWLAHPLFAPASANNKLKQKLTRIVADYSGWHWLSRDPERPLHPPAVERLHEIQAPALIVVGDQDLPDFQRIAALLDRQIPHANLVEIRGAGHLTNMEAPDTFNAQARAFLLRNVDV